MDGVATGGTEGGVWICVAHGGLHLGLEILRRKGMFNRSRGVAAALLGDLRCEYGSTVDANGFE